MRLIWRKLRQPPSHSSMCGKVEPHWRRGRPETASRSRCQRQRQRSTGPGGGGHGAGGAVSLPPVQSPQTGTFSGDRKERAAPQGRTATRVDRFNLALQLHYDPVESRHLVPIPPPSLVRSARIRHIHFRPAGPGENASWFLRHPRIHAGWHAGDDQRSSSRCGRRHRFTMYSRQHLSPDASPRRKGG